jgi:hypothetical protein
MYDDLILHLLFHTNAGIASESEKISESEVKKWIGIMFAMTLSPISNIEDYWIEQDIGFIPAHSFGIKTCLSKKRFKFIRKPFTTGAVGSGSKTFDAFQPIQTFFNTASVRASMLLLMSLHADGTTRMKSVLTVRRQWHKWRGSQNQFHLCTKQSVVRKRE